jgi:alkylation response protein AidB-like acyl-CoA dehydrogenase
MARVYRNSRIDRIWEGTNEINRMVIYGYFLKKALMEELPLRDAEKGWDADGPSDSAGALSREIEAIDVSRRLTVKCLFEAISRYGQDLRNQQVIGEDLADLVIGYFAASSAVNRILQLGDETHRDAAYRALGRLVTATYLEDAWRLYYRLRPILFSDNYAQRLIGTLEERMRKLHLPFDPVKELEVLTDDLFHHGRYRFE